MIIFAPIIGFSSGALLLHYFQQRQVINDTHKKGKPLVVGLPLHFLDCQQ